MFFSVLERFQFGLRKPHSPCTYMDRFWFIYGCILSSLRSAKSLYLQIPVHEHCQIFGTRNLSWGLQRKYFIFFNRFIDNVHSFKLNLSVLCKHIICLMKVNSIYSQFVFTLCEDYPFINPIYTYTYVLSFIELMGNPLFIKPQFYILLNWLVYDVPPPPTSLPCSHVDIYIHPDLSYREVNLIYSLLNQTKTYAEYKWCKHSVSVLIYRAEAAHPPSPHVPPSPRYLPSSGPISGRDTVQATGLIYCNR